MVSKTAAEYLVVQQEQQAQLQEDQTANQIQTEYVAPELTVTDVQISLSSSMFCADGISITLLTLLSVSLAGITMFRKKPREILSAMILEANHISYTYRTQKNIPVLHQISAGFQAGRFYSIIGSSGSGKTTFLSLLAGLDTPGEGVIQYDGEDIQKCGLNFHRRHHISLVFQNYNLIDYLTAQENVKLGGTKDPRELLTKVNIPQDAWNRNVLQLSGGQQQRVAIARALASEAKVLLADEPTGNLDETTTGEIIELLKQTAHELGKCVIVVTHSREVAQAADHILKLDHGTLI